MSEHEGRRVADDETIAYIKGGAPISRLLPIKAANGGTWMELTIQCKGCDEDLPDGQTRAYHHEPIQGVHVVKGYALCRQCSLATPFHYRLMRDGRMEGPNPHRPGQWVSWNFLSRQTVPIPEWWDLIGHYRLARRVFARWLKRCLQG